MTTTSSAGRSPSLSFAFVLRLAILPLLPLAPRAAADETTTVVEAPFIGGLDAIDASGRTIGACALKHTAVDVRISFPFARVTVSQTFHNPFDAKIDAVYTFPLGADAAVDSFEMVVGERVIRGEVRERGAAREEYEAARRDGHVASLLDQERPNVFTQSVANVEPGTEVTVRIGTVETLSTEDGLARFAFPMVVAPRYVPARPRKGDGGVDLAPLVPDAALVTPPVAPPALRAGHAVSLRARIDSGGPGLAEIRSAAHEVTVTDETIGADGLPRAVTLELTRGETIPNRDFVLSFRLVPDGIRESLFAHASADRGKFVTLVLAPPDRVDFESAMPREVVFVVDVSGSMQGAPIEAAKRIVTKSLQSLREDDTFNVVTFAGYTDVLFPTARPATRENRERAVEFIEKCGGGGGTEMMTAIRAALEPEAARRTVRRGPRGVRVHEGEDDGGHAVAPVRIVAFLTDGLVGNDLAILDAVRRHAATTRVFGFGIGSSVNRFLIDGLARAGRGASEIVLPGESADGKVERFLRRIATPVLTDVTVEWSEGIDGSTDLVPDLFDVAPLVLHARAARAGAASVTVRGTTPLGPYERTIEFDVPEASENDGEHPAIATLWARERVARLLWQDLDAAQKNTFPDDVKAEIVKLGESFRIATPFTSFVAVDRESVTTPTAARLATVPVEAPLGGFGRSWGRVPPTGRTPNDPATSPRGATPGRAGGGRRAGAEGFERFEFWWEHERETFFPLPSDRPRPEPAAREAAVKTIERALDDPDPEVRAAAAIALGRSRAAGAETRLEGKLARHEGIVTESATIGLGLLGRAAAVRPLVELLEGAGSPAAQPRTRAFAAAALALVVEDDGRAIAALERALRDPEHEVAILAAIALGARGGERAESALAALAAEKSTEPFVRAHAVAALGRAGGPAAESILRDALSSAPEPVERSAAVGFGSLAGPLEAASLAALRARVGPERGDVQIRNWALIALGRGGDDATREFLLAALDTELRSSRSASALGLALHGRRTPLDERAVSSLRERLADSKDPSVSAALAIALGLLRDPSSIGALRDLARKPVTPSLRGAAAEALALMGDSASVPDLLLLYRDPNARRDEDLARSLRLALARLSCREAAPLFLADVERADADPRGAASAAQALGTLGDPSTLPRLAELAASGSPTVRAYAVVAIGLVLADDPAALARAFSTGVNYRALVPALTALLDLL